MGLTQEMFGRVLNHVDGRDLLAAERIKLMLVSEQAGEIVQWIE